MAAPGSTQLQPSSSKVEVPEFLQPVEAAILEALCMTAGVTQGCAAGGATVAAQLVMESAGKVADQAMISVEQHVGKLQKVRP